MSVDTIISKTVSKNQKQSNNLCYIYKHIRLDRNEVFYIGKGTNTDESKKKMSESGKGKKHTEETKKIMSDAKKGKKGKKRTEEHKNKISQANIGHKRNLGRKNTQEVIEKMRQAHIGKKLSPEDIEKMCKPVGQYSKDGNLIKKYPSGRSTEIDGYNPSKVGDCCNGKRKTHGGFKWKFL